MPRTTKTQLTHEEAAEVADLIYRCANRFGPFAGRVGAAHQRLRLFKAIDRPTAATWARAHVVYITAGAGQLTLGNAVNLFTDFDSTSGPHPSRQQMLDALAAATGGRR
jgi:hypothetical protein